MNSKKHGLILVIFVLLASGVNGQNRDSLRRAMIDSILAARYYKTPYDTNYVVRPAGFSYQGGSIETTEDLKERAPNVPLSAYAYKKEEVLSSRIAPLFS